MLWCFSTNAQAVGVESCERRHLQESYLELGADGGPPVLRADLQRVLLVAALDAFKQVVDKVQTDWEGKGGTQSQWSTACWEAELPTDEVYSW